MVDTVVGKYEENFGWLKILICEVAQKVERMYVGHIRSWVQVPSSQLGLFYTYVLYVLFNMYFFYWLGDNVRLSAMDSTAKALGLGEPTGIELPEAAGQRANKETK